MTIWTGGAGTNDLSQDHGQPPSGERFRAVIVPPQMSDRVLGVLDRIDSALAAVADCAVSQATRRRAGNTNRPRNDLLRAARLRRMSPSGSGRPMSRQELADLVNAQLALQDVRHAPLDGGYIGKLERGVHRWPQLAYREAFRRVLDATEDAELGFYVRRRPSTS